MGAEAIMGTHETFFGLLMTGLTATMRPGEISASAESLPGLLHVRDCVARLVGRQSECILWDSATARCEVPRDAGQSAPRGYVLWVLPSRYSLRSKCAFVVALEGTLRAYFNALILLIGQGLFDHQLRRCFGM
jgi:hypothetical protein